MTDFNLMFGTGKKYVSQSDVEKGNPMEYKVSYKNGKDNVYTSLIRFVVNPRDPKNSIISKEVTWLKDPSTQRSRPVDNPKSINADYNPINALFWHYYSSKDATTMENIKKYIKTSTQHASIIQIIQDNQRPELNGKFMIFRYGKKIQDMIDAENAGNSYLEGRDPFNPFTGRCFLITCCEQGGNNNYDQSRFIDFQNNGLMYDSGKKDASGAPVMFSATPDTPGIQQFLYNYMIEKTPVLEEYAYKPWDSATEDYVTQVLQNIANSMEGKQSGNMYNPGNSIMDNVKTFSGKPGNVSDFMTAQNVAQQPVTQQQIPTVSATQAPVPELNTVQEDSKVEFNNQFEDLEGMTSFF